ATREEVEHADCLVLVGTVVSDMLSGGFSSSVKPAAVFNLHEAHVGDLVLPGVELADALSELVAAVRTCHPRDPRPPQVSTPRPGSADRCSLWATAPPSSPSRSSPRSSPGTCPRSCCSWTTAATPSSGSSGAPKRPTTTWRSGTGAGSCGRCPRTARYAPRTS